jgi:hypothetical protein
MPRPRPNARRDEQTGLSFLDTARSFYGDAFGSRSPRNVDAARDDWAELPEEDRSFANAHLLYLNLMAQAGIARLLVQVRDLLEEIADALPEEPEDFDDEDEHEAGEPFDEAPELFDAEPEPESTQAAPPQGQPQGHSVETAPQPMQSEAGIGDEDDDEQGEDDDEPLGEGT